MMSRTVMFLDRDGTINVDHGYVHRIEDWEFIDGALEALQLLHARGYALAVVTNQSGVARAYYTVDNILLLHDHMKREAARHGVPIDAVAFCPHGPQEDCTCRKPRTGMAQEVESQLGEAICYEESWTVGDKPADVQFGSALRTRTALLKSRYWRESELCLRPDIIATTLLEAANAIVDR